MTARTPCRPRARQEWAVGQTVSVGFLKGLTVVEKMPTPGDFAPDAWVLRSCYKDQMCRWYRFVPHLGIQRAESLADARIP